MGAIQKKRLPRATPIFCHLKKINEAIVSLHMAPKICDEATQFISFKQISSDEAIVSLHWPPKAAM